MTVWVDERGRWEALTDGRASACYAKIRERPCVEWMQRWEALTVGLAACTATRFVTALMS